MPIAPITIGSTTTTLLIDSSRLTSGEAAIVQFPPIPASGRIVTVRDSAGYLSSPQQIILSTISSAQFLDGTTRLGISTPFGFASLQPQNSTTWTLTNTFGFQIPQATTNSLTLNLSTLRTETFFTQQQISTGALTTQGLSIQSTLRGDDIGSQSSLFIRSIPSASTTLFVDGNSQFEGGLQTSGPVFVQGLLSTGQGLTAQDLQVRGNLLVTGNLILDGTISTSSGVLTVGNLTSADSVQVSSGITQFQGSDPITLSSLYVGETLSGANPIAPNFQVTSHLHIGGNTFSQNPSGELQLQGFLSTLAISTTQLASSTLTEVQRRLNLGSTLVVNGNWTLGQASIQNASGQVQTAAVSFNTLQGSSSGNVQGNVLTVQTANLSTLQLSSLSFASDASFQSDTINFTQTVAALVSTGTANGFMAQISSVATQSLAPRASLTLDNLSSLVLNAFPSTILGAPTGSVSSFQIRTTDTRVRQTQVLTSTIVTSNSMTWPGASILRGTTQNLDTAVASRLISTQTLDITDRFSMHTLATLPTKLPNEAPLFQILAQSNVMVAGTGSQHSPLQFRSQRDIGVEVGDPQNSALNLRLSNPNSVSPVTARIFLNWNWNNQTTGQVRLQADGQLVTQFLGNAFANQRFSTLQTILPFPSTNQISVRLESYSASNDYMSGLIQIQQNGALSNAFLSNTSLIQFRNGRIDFPQSQDTITIQNSLNDIGLRNLQVTGLTFQASDSTIKEQIEVADPIRCSEAISGIPLHQFRLKDSQVSTHGIQDVHKLGILTTEVEPQFPKSVINAAIPSEDGPLRKIDMTQIEQAHMATTQDLFHQVAEIQSTLASLNRF